MIDGIIAAAVAIVFLGGIFSYVKIIGDIVRETKEHADKGCSTDAAEDA